MNEWDNYNNNLFKSWSFGKINYKLFGIGLLTVILGFVLMATGETESIQSIRISPIILIIGYCILIPAAILVKPKNKD